MPSPYLEKPTRTLVEALAECRLKSERADEIDSLARAILSPPVLLHYECLVQIKKTAKPGRRGRSNVGVFR